MFRFAGLYPGQTRGSCVSPSVHRQPALFRDRAGSTRASVERRSPRTNRAPHRSGDRPTARLRVCRLHRSRGRRGGDPALQPATVQGAPSGGERSAAAGRSSPGSATWRLQQPPARGSHPRVSAAPGPAATRRVPPRVAARPVRAAVTSVPTRRPRTSASRHARTPTAVPRVRSRNVRSAVFTTRTRTGAPKTKPTRPSSTTSRPARRMATPT